MEDNELHYLTYDEDELWMAMSLAYIEAGGDVMYPGDEKEMLLRGVQSILMQAFAGIDNALRMDTLRYAVRDYLDIYGEKRSCYRIEATAATATITITARDTGEEHTIPAGASLTQDGSLFWTLDDDIVLSGNAETITAGITASTAGTAGNGLTTGMEMTFAMADYNELVTGIVAAGNASGGQNREDDETYRERIRTYGLAAATTGTSEMYERVARETSSEIIDAKALNEGDLEVAVYLILAEGATASTIIDAVTEALSPKDTRPLSDNVTVEVAEALSYTLKINYKADEAAGLTDALAEAVAEYQSWQDEHIGQAFNPDMLVAYLYRAGCSLVTIGSGSSFNGSSTIEYTEIDPEQCCKGTVTLTAVST